MFQITKRLIADISFSNGDAHAYVITDEQLDDARQKMRHGLGSLEWTPRHGATPGQADIINVRAVDRIRPWTEDVLSNALVQLWHRPQTHTLYLGDPDDARHLFKLVNPTRDSMAIDPREFGREAYELIGGDYTLRDVEGTLFIAVGRPTAEDAPDMTLIAEHRNIGGARLLVDPSNLDDVALGYLGNRVITDYNELQQAHELTAAAQ
jgi:hypothetical protein